MLFIDHLTLVSAQAEIGVIKSEQRTIFNTFYPFKIFPDKGLQEIDFAPVTIFYGGNGSGKSTLLNIIAEKLHLKRHAPFSGGAFFDRYVRLCQLQDCKVPRESMILTSDDVFEYLLYARNMNNGIDSRRDVIESDYFNRKNPDAPNVFTSLADYDEWLETHEARRKTLSQYTRERVVGNIDMFSNGESAMRYFVDRITANALYLLDEPENSLSIGYQEELCRFLADSARFYHCQIVMATHSPVLLSMPGARIYDLDSDPVKIKRWTELENVRKYFDFFEKHREEFLS